MILRGGGGAGVPQRAGEIDPVETQDDVGTAQSRDAVGGDIARRAGMQRMIRREARADLEIGHDTGVERLGECDAGVPGFFAARGAPGEDHDLPGRLQHRRRLAHQVGRRGSRNRRHVAPGIDRRQLLGELRLLHAGVEIDVDRAHRRRVGDPGAAQQSLARGAGRGRLIVPFGVAAHQRALVLRGVDPVDPRPPLHGVDGTGRAENQHRHAVAPGVEQGHGGVEETDIGVDRGGHRLAGDLGVTVRDGDGALLVQAEQHLRRRIAEVVDEAVVQAAIARARRQRDVGDVEHAQRVGDDIAAERRCIHARRHRTLHRGNRGISAHRLCPPAGAQGIGRRHRRRSPLRRPAGQAHRPSRRACADCRPRH